MSADDREDLIFRTGTFFMLVGIGVIILFGASMCVPASPVENAVNDLQTSPGPQTGNNLQTNGPLFLAGVVSLLFGWWLKRLTAPPPKPPSNRFQWMRALIQKLKTLKITKGKK